MLKQHRFLVYDYVQTMPFITIFMVRCVTYICWIVRSPLASYWWNLVLVPGERWPVPDWATQVKVVTGNTRGIIYLHEDCKISHFPSHFDHSNAFENFCVVQEHVHVSGIQQIILVLMSILFWQAILALFPASHHTYFSTTLKLEYVHFPSLPLSFPCWMWKRWLL